jgi:hypothetical protein
VSPLRYVNGQRALFIVLYRVAFTVFDCMRGRSVSCLVVRRVVDEGRDFERAVVPLVEVVLFRFFHHGCSRMRQ